MQTKAKLRTRFLCIEGQCPGTEGTLVRVCCAPRSDLNIYSYLGDAGLRFIMDALPHARRLRELTCHDRHMSEAFARNCLLPAVRACASLRTLDADDSPVREAKALLQQRR
jgi:hypothetical protein